MMYLIKLTEKMLEQLWILREYAAEGTIVSQVRQAVNRHIQSQKKKYGVSIKELREILDEHQKEKEPNSQRSDFNSTD